MLFQAPEVKLVRLFSPEHGIRGEVDASVPDGKDAKTGLPIVSLYGPKKKPAPADLDGLDVLVFDIQDIGVRYYTYSTTLGLVLEAAQESGKRVGRARSAQPARRPRGGRAGARSRARRRSSPITPLPVRHGLTVGELARLYNGERKLGAQAWRSSPAVAGPETRPTIGQGWSGSIPHRT